jgi:hypothetical protein
VAFIPKVSAYQPTHTTDLSVRGLTSKLKLENAHFGFDCHRQQLGQKIDDPLQRETSFARVLPTVRAR